METMRYPSDCAAVTGACQMVRRDVFENVGGFDEQLAVVLNDVDLCLKVRESGYLVVFDPQAKLHHSEHASRGRDEQDVSNARWDKSLIDSGFINPNLNQCNGHFKITW